jgi:hypothetical protein
LYVDYNGKRIYVCCNACLGEVKKSPQKAIDKLTQLGQSPESL